MQKLLITGNLGKDPELRDLPNGTSVCNLNVACTERWTKDGQKHERTEWFRCSAYGRMGEIIAEYAKSGEEISLEGKLQTREYEKDGQKRYITDVIVSEFEFRRGVATDAPASKAQQPPPDDFGDDEIPF